uniref:Uncharacterized protein n=1 Tax=Hucho hucho TaxID=62062 RepID=A0A4W5QU87_9TELE
DIPGGARATSGCCYGDYRAEIRCKGVENATACVINGTIFVTGGHYGSRGGSTYENIQAYKPDINEWIIVTITPHPGMTHFKGSGHIFSFVWNIFSQEIIVFMLSEYGLCSVTLNNKLYLGGQTRMRSRE